MSKPEAVSNGENVLKPNLSANSVTICKTLSKSENLSNPETLKTNFKNLSKNSTLSKTEAVSENYKPLFCQTCTTFQRATTIGHNVLPIHAGRDLTDELPTKYGF